LTKESLYVYFGPVAVLVCRRFDLSLLHNQLTISFAFADDNRVWSKRLQDNSPTNQLAVSQVADWITRGLVNSLTTNFKKSWNYYTLFVH